jgi:hypothetical protein
MFSDETERWDWIIGIVVTAIVVGALYWIRSQPIEQETTAVAPIESLVEQHTPEKLELALENHEQIIVNRRSSPSTIARVFECERDDGRVLSDRPCGDDATVLSIAAPNRMQRQDTSVLYEPLPRSIQMQKRRAAEQRPGGDPSICARIDEEKERINARMRKPYRHREGEYYRERLRQLSAQRWDAGCGRSSSN